MTNQETLMIRGEGLTLQDVVDVARHGRPVALTAEARERIAASFNIVLEIIDSGVPTYGISTGFGELSNVYISREQNGALQKNLIMSHACAVGDLFPEEIVRAIMLLRLNTLASGFSGVQPVVTERLADFLNRGITPVVPSQGSLGASGDLANLAHVALPLLGLGEVFYRGERRPAEEVLRECALEPCVLQGKDGLALINGTQVMSAVGALACYDAERLFDAANCSCALTFEAFRGITAALDPRIHALRPHAGQARVAKTLLALTKGSSAINTRQGDVQDPYTLRCVPQVHGAVYDALQHVHKMLEIEINSVTDNPLVFPDDHSVISGGNFHGEPLALHLDFLGIAVSELANIAERRIERMVNPQLSGGLSAFLVKESGVNSGFMIPQYAAAALVSENKVLAHPASVDSIPSSANKEDHVSMGAIAARKARQIVQNVRYVLAIELMVAAQAIDLREIEQLGQGTRDLYKMVRERVTTLEKDRFLHPDIEKLAVLLQEDAFYALHDRVVGTL